MTRKTKSKVGRRLMLAGMIAILVGFLLVFGIKAWHVVWCLRLERAVHAAAAEALGADLSAATILRAREAILSVARERGVERPVLRAAIERRTGEDGGQSYVVAFELCAVTCHATFERALPGPLGDTEMATLKAERIGEHTGTRWKHHHHEGDRARPRR